MMKRNGFMLSASPAAALFLFFCASAHALGAASPEACRTADKNPQRRINFDRDWKFQRGNPENAQAREFDDSRWRILDLPHDWSIEALPDQDGKDVIGPFSRRSVGAWDTGYVVGGEAWYRKNLFLGKEDEGKRIRLYFEGVYNQAEVYVNGEKAAFNAYGYSSFKVDLTPFCRFGEPNAIAVKVVNQGRNSRWYSGSGIYRHVWLEKTPAVHLDEWDVFVDASRVKNGKAQVQFQAVVRNPSSMKGSGSLTLRIVSPEGETAHSETMRFESASGEEAKLETSFEIADPQLWSQKTPNMYEAVVSLEFGGLKDRLVVPFGIRTLEFSAEKGFLLNGEPTLLKGGCLHHDNGLLGSAAIERAEERKLELLKANGFNAVRCSHNPPTNHFLDLCDRMGILVVDESFDMWRKPKLSGDDYHRWFDEWSEHDLSTMVRRDRNHPSVIMWSVGNEIPECGEDDGIATMERLTKIVKSLDSTRPTTAAVHMWCARWNDNMERAMRHLDVGGYNYPDDHCVKDHEAFPNRVMFLSETFPKTIWRTWDLTEKKPYVIGDFVWTAFDYLGEVGLAHNLYLAPGEKGRHLMEWPWYNAWCGDLDFCGDKKPQSYFRDVLWGLREISLAAQPPIPEGKTEDVSLWGWPEELLSWNWTGLEGKTMKVNVYSRSKKARLYLNGRLIGEKDVDPLKLVATFDVPYEPGSLKAVCVENGEEGASAELRTTGKPVRIRLTADRNEIKASKDDLSYVKIELLDRDGNLVQDQDAALSIVCDGAGRVAAAGNGAFQDMASFRSLAPKTFRGRAIAILQPDEKKGAGEIRLTVSSEGLEGDSIVVRTR